MDRAALEALEAAAEEVRRRRLNADGGPGSGHWGHRGRPGARGGALPGSGTGTAGNGHRIRMPDGSWTSISRMQKEAAGYRLKGAARADDTLKKAEKLRSRYDAMGEDRRAEFMVQAGVLSESSWKTLRRPGAAEEDRKAAAAELKEAEEKYFRQTARSMEQRVIRSELQERVAAMSSEERTKWILEAAEREEDPTGGALNWDEDSQRVAYALGLNGTPQVISRKDFDSYVESLGPDGPEVMYRGVESSRGVTAAHMQYQMAYAEDEPFIGRGLYGDGLYFSTREQTADEFAGEQYRNMYGLCDGTAGTVSRAVLRPDARILKTDAMEHDLKGTEKGAEVEKAVGFLDLAVYAMATGHDAIEVELNGGEKYIAVLNKAAMIMEDPMEDWKIQLMGLP